MGTLPAEITALHPRRDLLVLGVGSPLRQDDRVGLELVQGLSQALPELHCRKLYELDILLAEELADYRHLLVIDALADDSGLAPDKAFSLTTIKPAPKLSVSSGFASHLFDWAQLLALARELYGVSISAQVLGVRAGQFAIADEISPTCAAAADRAFDFLLDYCTEPEPESS